MVTAQVADFTRRAALLKSRAHTYEYLKCGCQTSVTAGTAMHRSKLSLTAWFWAANLMSTHSNGMSARQLEDQLGLTYKTAWLRHRRLQPRAGERNSGLLDKRPLEQRPQRRKISDQAVDADRGPFLRRDTAQRAHIHDLAAVGDADRAAIEANNLNDVSLRFDGRASVPECDLLNRTNPRGQNDDGGPPAGGAIISPGRECGESGWP
jgi:hypothetical protein